MIAIIMQMALPDVAYTIFAFVLGVCLAAMVQQIIARTKAKAMEQNLQRQIEGAKKEAENIIKSAQIDAAEETIKKREQFNSEVNKIRAELHEMEMRLSKREDVLDRQVETVQQQEKSLKQQEKEVEKRLHNITAKESQLSAVMAQQKNQLLKITAMNINEAKELLLKRLEDECEHEMSAVIQRRLEEANETVSEKSREIINAAIQRYASEQTCEVTVSTVEIPNDDMKGRIIGREGRNRFLTSQLSGY